MAEPIYQRDLVERYFKELSLLRADVPDAVRNRPFIGEEVRARVIWNTAIQLQFQMTAVSDRSYRYAVL